jgi:hypothetical protein
MIKPRSLLLSISILGSILGAMIVHADNPPPASWNDHWWLEKTSRALRGGDSVSTDENPDALLAQGREQVVASFIKDPRFGDTVLDFSLMFLGFRQDRLKREKGIYFPTIYKFPQAIQASQEVLKDGDYFRLFDLYQPLYAAPISRPLSADPADAPLADVDLTKKYIKIIQNDLDSMIAIAPTVTDQTKADFCSAKFITHVDNYLFSAFGTYPILSYPDANVAVLSLDWYGSVWDYCFGYPPANFDLTTGLMNAKAKNAQFFAQVAGLEPTIYGPKTVDGIRTVDTSFEPTYKFLQFKNLQLQALTNSSTNYDRKRSAYVLKRFFCDDLTPVGVQFPAVHAAGKHGSDPSCFSCHYKLDPMAGFFRNFGQNFHDFSNGNRIVFDDGAFLLRKDYEQNWAGGPDADHPLNIGYIRSTKDLTQNYYGSSLDDLYNYLKIAPEVRRCIMKRAYEYLVSEDQSVDGDYLDYLTDQFNKDIENRGSSGIALKNAFARIVLGPGFSTPNVDHSNCYDRRPGYVPSGGVPCQVSSILNKTCVSCHSSTGGPGGLDLAHWETSPNGSKDGSGGFPHIDSHGIAVPHAQTFQMIMDRLNSNDPNMQMPYLTDMLTADRQQLYLWANQQLSHESLNTLNKGGSQ